MADSNVGIDEPESGAIDKKVDTSQLTVGGETVQRQRIVIASDTGDVEIAEVSAANGLEVDVTRVQGTVAISGTVDLGATDNAVLDAIAASLAGTLAVDGSGVTQPISHAALTELAAAIDTELQVDVVGALPAGDNNIGNVDIVTVPAPLNLVGGGAEAAALRVTLANDSTGVITANLGAVDNAVLDAIAASLAGTLTVDGSGSTQPISGTVTANLGATDNAVLDAMAASLALLDDAVGGSELQVDVVGPLPAGTAHLGSIEVKTPAGDSAMDDTNDALRVNVVAGAAAGTEYTEDAAGAGGESGPFVVGRRQDGDTSPVSADGDYHGLVFDDAGNLKVNIKAGAGSGGTASTDDAAFGAGSGNGTPAMGFFSADTVDAGDVGVLAMDASRRLLVSLEVDNVGIGGGTQYTEDDAAPANPVGNALLAERDDALGGLTPAEGDWTHLFVDANGAVWMHDVNSAAILSALGGTLAVDGSGATQPVSGTITANLGAVDNAVLDAIAASLAGTLTVDGSGSTQPVSGTVTANLGATDNAVLDAIAAATAAIQASVEILDNAIAGSEMQVDIVSGGTGSTQYAEDSAHGSGDTGTMALAVRQDTGAALAGTDGDYSPLQVDADGNLRVNVAASAASGVFSEDDAHNSGDAGIQMLVVRNDSLAALAGTDGDYAPLQVDANGALYVTGGGGGTEYTEDAAAPANPVGSAFVMERDDALAGLTPVEGDWTHPYATAEGALWVQDFNSDAALAHLATLAGAVGGSEVQVDIVSGTVDLGATDNAVLDAIQAAVETIDNAIAGSEMQVDIVSMPAVDLGSNNDVQGAVAHDAVASGNPFLTGFKAVAHGASPTAVAAADATWGHASRHGIPFVMGGHPNIITRRDNYTSAQTDTSLVTIATSNKIVVTRCSVLAANSNSVDVSARVGFGTANTPTGAGVVLAHPGIAAGSGLSEGNGSGMLGVGADNEDLRFTCSVPTGGSVTVVTSYYVVPS